eukprot:4213055-Alexandrium_andersonii.AAC.1
MEDDEAVDDDDPMPWDSPRAGPGPTSQAASRSPAHVPPSLRQSWRRSCGAWPLTSCSLELRAQLP